MKPRRLATCSLLFISLSTFSQAADIVKANNATALDTAGSWTGGVLPAAADVAVFTSGSGATAPVGTGLTVAGLRYTNAAAYNITVGTGSLTVGASGIDLTAATNGHTISAPLVLNANQQWNVANTRTLTISGTSGLNQGSNNVSLNGLGTVAFSPTSTFTAGSGTGTITVNGGTLNLTNGNVGTLTNAVSSTTVLAVGGGNVQMTVGANVGVFTQNFASFTINAGASSFFSSRGANSQWVINLGAVTRNVGGTVNLTTSSNASSGYRFGSGSNGIIGGSLTINGTDFPRYTNATTLVGNNGVTAPTYATDTWAAANNTNVATDTTQTGATTNSLRFGAASARTLTLSGTNTLTSGGLLVSSGVGAFNNLITGGALRGSNGGDLIVHQHNTGGTLTIASEIANNTTATALTKTGAGTLILSGTNTFTGSVFLNAGILQLGSAGGLNTTTPNQLVFTNNSSARLQLFGNSATLSGVATSTVLAATLPIIENAGSTDSVLTVSNSSPNTFPGTLQNGAGTGLLGLTKSNTGTLTLTGTNTSTGPVQVSAGTLALSGATALPASTITVGSGATLDLTARTGGGLALSSTQTLAGSGSVSGAITTVLGSKLVPGGNGNIGTLTTSSLNLGVATTVNFELPNSGTSGDVITVGTANGLVLGSGILVNLSPTTGGQFANGIGNTYTLFNYSGTLSGVGTSAGTITAGTFTVNNPVGGLTYTFNDTGSAITLTIGGSLANDATWQGGVNLSWNTAGNWTTGVVPQNAGDSARFGNAIGTTPTAITLDGSKTVALVQLNNAAASYTLNAGSGGGLTLDNGVSSGQVNVTAGTHTVNVPVSLSSSTVFGVTGSGDSLTLTADLGGSGNLTKTGSGLLALNGTSSHSGVVNLNGGTTSVVSGALGTSGDLNFGGGTLRFATGNTEDVSSVRFTNLVVGGGTFDTNGNDVGLAGSIQGSGGLTKAGSGVLTLSGSNNYAGNTTINGGTLKVGAIGNLGATPGVATPGNLTIGAGTLELTAGIAFPANRGVALTSPSASIVLPASTTSTISGIIAGTGKLNLSGTGTLTLAGANTYSGGTVIEVGGLVTLNSGTALGTGQTELRDSQVTINAANATLSNLLVATGKTGTVDGLQLRPAVAGLTGAGDVTFLTRTGGNNAQANAFGFQLRGSYTGFTGTLRLKSAIASTVNTFPLHFNGGGFNGDLSNATVILSDYARLSGVNASAGNTVNIGALSGDSTSILSGADYVAFNTYNIGGKNLDTTFDGLINNGSVGPANIVKSGTGSLTLTGTNTYSGTTTINTGTLAVTNASALGSNTTGTTITGGDVNGRLSITGGLNITEPLTLGGRQGSNFDSAHVLNTSGNNLLTAAAITPAAGGNSYNVQSDAGILTVASSFIPSGAVTGVRFLQVQGDGNGEWSGSIQNGTASIFLNKNGAGAWTLSGTNSHTGDTTVYNGTLLLSSTGELKFAPTTNGTSNKLTGVGTVSLDGKFNIDLTAANVTTGNSWLLVDVAGLTETFGSNFSVTGFTKSGTNWTKVDGANTWTFSQTTGTLSLTIVTDPFIPWIATFFPGETNAAIIGKAADPDNDGRNNLAEFAFNSSPSSAVNDGKVVGKTATVGGNSVLTLTLPVRTGATFTDDVTTHEEVSGLIDGVIYRIQGSDDLTAWTLDVSEVGAGAELTAIQAGLPTLGTGWTYRTFRAPGTVSSSGSDFLRIKVTE